MATVGKTSKGISSYEVMYVDINCVIKYLVVAEKVRYPHRYKLELISQKY
jgi:hypothetical protein